MKKIAFIIAISIITTFMFSCGGGGGGSAVNEVFTISYNANGAESGVAPAKQSGDEDSPQAIQANTGNLTKSGYLFDGWNTDASGSGTNYAPGVSYKGKSITLYAKWAAIFNVQVITPPSPAPALNGVQRALGVPYIRILSLTAKGRTLSNINIPASIDGYTVVSIGSGAFQGCDTFTAITIPESVTSIDDNAFAGCTGISSLIIPRSVTSIGDGAFSGCAGLNSLILLTATPPAMGTGALEGTTAAVSVPAAGVDDYKAAEGWNTYSSNIAGYSTETYIVTFDGQGATTAASPTSIAVVPPAVTVGQLPTSPLKTGYIFGGWYKQPDGAGGEFTASTVVSSNMTVYANWEEYSYTVEFDDQGATTPVSPTSKTVASPNTTVGSLPSEPENTGYYFGGWNTKADGTGTVFTASTPVTDNIRVYAIWMNNPTRIVTFDSQGATTVANPTTKQVVSPAVTIDSLPTAPKKTGYLFGGWYKGTGGTGGEFTASTVVADDIIVYAYWETYEYTVEFDSQGAETEANPTSITISSPNTIVGGLPSNPVKRGHTFGGWFTEPGGQGTQIKTSTVVNSNLRVYAKWTAKTYQITYKDQGEKTFSGKHENNYPVKHKYGTDTVLDVPTKPGYLFKGWYLDSNCSGSPVTQLDATAYTQDIRLYAKWTCYFTYETFISNNSLRITGLIPEGKNLSSIIVPPEIEGKTILSIEGFNDCTNIVNISLPDTLREIGYAAFMSCTNLVNINLPNELELGIGNDAFANCVNLVCITIPDNITRINDGTFANCKKLSSITIPDSVTYIGEQAFSVCDALTSITIPGGVTTICDSAFRGCDNLTSITVDNSNNAFSSVDGVLFNKNKTKLICFPKGKSNSSYTVPNTVTVLGDYAFTVCNITHVYLPNGLTTIGTSSFLYCTNLTEITIPSNVAEISQNTFIDCTNLSTVKVERLVPPTAVDLFQPGGLFNGTLLQKIIVPAESVDAYKAANGWSEYAALIVADE